MKRILILFLFIYLDAFGKNVISYNGKRLNITKKISIFEYRNENVKEEDIIKGLHDDKFKGYDRNILYLWNNNSTYYIKIEIHNLSNKKRLSLYGWLSELSLKRTDISYVYLKENKLIEEKFTRKIDKDDKDSLLNYGHLSFDIGNKEAKTIYIKSKSILISPLILTEKENIIKEERIYLFITSIFIGLSLLVLIIIFISYLRLKKSYLLYYILIFLFTYLKSNLFLKYLRNYISDSFSHRLYTIFVVLYIFSLVEFVIKILNLEKGLESIKIKSHLTFIKYTSLFLGSFYFLNLLSYDYFLQSMRYIYLALFTLILYSAIRRYSYSWLYKSFFFSWLPQWLLYVYLNAAQQFKLRILIFDIRVIEYLEIFVNLLSIAAILVYDAKELWKGKNTVEDQEEFINIINGADNLMHGLLTLIHSYKKEIKFDRVMFFRRKVDRENEEVLHYDFSVPLSLNERDEEKKYFDLAKYLRKDSFDTYYICEDIQSNELYKTLLPKYKSLIELRLKFVEGGDLGYIVILSNNKIEYEYNEVMKDFRYKASLLVQHFKTIDDIRDKYGSIIVEETLRNFHMEVLRDAEKDVSGTLEQLVKIRTISDKYVVANDPNVKRVLNLFYDDLEKLMINIKKDLTFDNPDKKTKSKIRFNYNIIEEMLNYLKDIARKTTNKVNINVMSQVDSDYELYGHIKIIRSIINHYLTYMYSKIIMSNIEANITISTTLEEGRLKIDSRVEGVNISLEELKKEYNNEVHKVLLNSTRSKLELKTEEDIVHIVYLLNLLTKEEKKRFDVKHLDYDDNEDI